MPREFGNAGEVVSMERSAWFRRCNWRVLVVSFCCVLWSAAAEAVEDTVVVPAWQRFRAEHLSAEQAGRLLITELNCQSCHGAYPGLTLQARQAPVLTAAARRLNPVFVRQFLQNPQGIKPGTAMPHLPAAAANPAVLDALTAFLTAGGGWRAQAVSADAIRRGEDLFHRVGCAACHGDQRSDEVIEALRRGLAPPADEEEEPEADAVGKVKPQLNSRPDFLMPLGRLEEKYSLSALIQFLREPHLVRPSGRMPSLNLSPEESRDVASYLLRKVQVEANIEYEYFEGSWNTLPDFSSLKPVSKGTTTDFSAGVGSRQNDFALRFLGYVQIPKTGEYRVHVTSDDGSRVLIDEQEVVNNDGIHPPTGRSGAVQLTAGSHALVVEYFEQGGGEELSVEIEGPELGRQPLSALTTLTRAAVQREPQGPVEPSAELVAEGRGYFAKLGCAACHQHGEGAEQLTSSVKAREFAKLNPAGGCLSVNVPAGLPVFALSDRQRGDLQAALAAVASVQSESAPASEVQQAMLSLNCYACHVRGDLGGVSEPLNHVFAGSIPEMGDEGRIPPALTGAGDKLNDEWIRTVLSEGAKDRPYMATRMPRFGGQHAEYFAPRLAAVDRGEVIPEVVFEAPDHRVKADARQLVGDQALSCIKCHRFDSYAATGLQSLDMTTMTRRLRRDWFHRYLADPQAYRPGTRMPAAWPGGRSVVPGVLNGEPELQIEAIWRYLLDGRRAKIPSGLERQAIELKPTGRPLIYRNFLEGLSPRGIAVGFPERVHFAWDAEHMTARLIWHGAFIDAAKHWVDRGPGNQSPMGDHVMVLPAGPPLAKLSSLDQSWPGGNPRETGYRFQGYRLNAAGVPTFRYQWNVVEVEETLTPVANEPDNGLRRTLTVKSAEPLNDLWLRVAAGKIEQVQDAFVWNGVRLQVEEGLAVVRRSGDQDELLIQLPAGVPAATVRLTLIW